jgi:D-sedoheptulose 7-phosphate isomerase
MIINFENIEDKCKAVSSQEEYRLLINKVNKVKRIYLIGNGGLHFVASHMSTDMSRLIPDKSVYSFDSVGFITSNANDHGYEMLFVRWLETIASIEDPSECLIIGLSCSGNSANVVNALHWGETNNFNTFLISGQKSEKLKDTVDELSFECDFFHTVEVSIMMLFYDLIHQTGNSCPSIRGEKNRLSSSPLRGN